MNKTIPLLLIVLLTYGCIDYNYKGDGIKSITNNSSFFEKKFVSIEEKNNGGVESIEINISILYKKKNLSENVSEEIRWMENETFNLINDERESKGLRRLKWNEELAYVARQHSKYLASKNKGFVENIYISHQGKDGEYHYDRLENNGIYYFMSSAENIFGISIVKTYYKNNRSPVDYYDVEELPFIATTSWMTSKLHRENILNEDFDETGIGIAKDETGTNYIFTQIFIKRVDCGYRYGQCCKKPGYYPYCLIPLKCEYNYCLNREDIRKIKELIDKGEKVS